MAGAFSVALVGFAENESATFESFFRMAARRPPAYVVQDEVMDAQVLIVNADNAQGLHLVRYAELPGKVLLVGHNDGGTGWPLQRKPIKLVGVLAALDELVGVRLKGPVHAPPVVPKNGADPGFAATEPASSVPLTPAVKKRKRSPDSEFPPTRPMMRTRVPSPPVLRTIAAPAPSARAGGVDARRHAPPPGVVGFTDFGGLDVLPTPSVRRAVSSRSPSSHKTAAPAPDVPRGDVLLVAESLVEGRILHKRFKRYGLTIDWSREAQQALVMMQAHAYRLVAIDRLKGEPDAYSVCRSAKQRKLPNGRSPVVMMFAPTAGSMDRIKAGLAGCDAYLSRSVGESEFYKVLAQHRLVSLDGFEKTNVGF